MDRALLIDPDNLNMRYNFACALAKYLNDREGALNMLEYVLTRSKGAETPWCSTSRSGLSRSAPGTAGRSPSRGRTP